VPSHFFLAGSVEVEHISVLRGIKFARPFFFAISENAKGARDTGRRIGEEEDEAHPDTLTPRHPHTLTPDA
jgi:hypothetical protein